MKTLLLTCLLSSTLLVAAGCSDEQLASIDRVVTDANTIGTGVTQITTGPAAALIPPQVRQIMQLLGIGLAGALAVWKMVQASGLLRKNEELGGKNQDLIVTLKALVDGVEASGDQGKPVKAQIKEIMRDREVYSVANPLVDQVKAQPAGKIS